MKKIVLLYILICIAINSKGQDYEFYWEPIPDTDGIHATIAVDDKTFFSMFPQPKLYSDGLWRDTPYFTDLYRMLSGDIVGATYGHVMKSSDEGITWDTLDLGIFVSDGMKKGAHNTLYVLRYDGIWSSEDEGLTWSHSCPEAYFPGFSVNARTITIARPNHYYGKSQFGDILSFDGAVHKEYASIQDGNRVTMGYAVNYSRDLYVMEKIIATQALSLYADSPGNPTHKIEMPASNTSSELDMYGSDLLLHSSNKVFVFSEYTSSWVDYTANLDSTSIITNISVAPYSNTIYLTLQNGHVHKSALRSVNTNNISDHSPNIYPNPTSDYIHLHGILNPNAQIQIVDFRGIIVKTIPQYNQKIDITDLPPGRYQLAIKGTNQSLPFIKI